MRMHQIAAIPPVLSIKSMPSASGKNTTTVAPAYYRAQDECAREILILVNRKAGSGRGRDVVDRVSDALTKEGFRVAVVTDFLELADHSSELFEAGRLRGVVAAGGDGTFGGALNIVPIGTPLAVLPMGTENLLGKYLGFDRSPETLIGVFRDGVVAPFDAACAGERRFAMMLSAGFDAEVVRRVSGSRKGNITHLAYAGPILGAMTSYRHPKIRVSWTDEFGNAQSLENCWTFALNMPRYALQLPIAPNAKGNDQLLDLCMFEHGSTLAGLGYFFQVLRRRHHLRRDVTTLRTPRCQLAAVGDEQIPFQVDGDPGGFLPITLSVEAGGMSIVLPKQRAESLGFAPRD